MRVERRAVAGLLGLLLCGGCLAGCGGNGGISSARSVAAPEAASSGLTVSDGEPVERELFAMDTYMNLRVWAITLRRLWTRRSGRSSGWSSCSP